MSETDSSLDRHLSESRGFRRLAVLVALVLLALPLAWVTIPPITDLPQHVAQVRLLGDALSEADSLYRVNALAPYCLGYLTFALGWAAAGPMAAGRIGFALLAALWLVALVFLAESRSRPWPAAILAGVLFWSHAAYWGFSSFLFGASVFFAFLALVGRQRSPARTELWLIPLLSLALYYSHALWLVAAIVFLGASRWARGGVRAALGGLALMFPAVVLAALWVPQLARSGFSSSTDWSTPPWQRLDPRVWIDSAFGGLAGPWEPIAFALLALWILAACWRWRRDPEASGDAELLMVAVALVAVFLLAPNRFQNTVHFSSRWLPPALALVLVALPLPVAKPRTAALAALGFLGVFSLVTSAAWVRFEAEELAGFEEALDQLPEAPKVLGLDFVRLSRFTKNQPFLQLHAYSQVLRGGELGFSFGSFPTSPVAFAEWENPPWEPGLEWFPFRIFERPSDVRHFSHILVHAGADEYRFFDARPDLELVSDPGRWRLYEVAKAERR